MQCTFALTLCSYMQHSSPRFIPAHHQCMTIGTLYIHLAAFFIGYACIDIINKSTAVIESLQAQALKNSPGRADVYRDCSHMSISAIACISRTNGRWPTVRKLTAAQLLPTPTYQHFSHCIRSLYIIMCSRVHQQCTLVLYMAWCH